MTIRTTPVFYFIDPITDGNQFLAFREPGQQNIELVAELLPGTRSMSDLATELERALNATGQLDYTVSLDRQARTYAIAASDNFDLLIDSGQTSSSSVFSLIGFTGSDLTGSNSYSANLAAGFEYSPQFLPQSYRAFRDNERSISSSVNESASGNIVESITFGTKRTMEMNIKYITDLPRKFGSRVINNPNALQETRNALSFMIQKREFEFMEDTDSRSTFDRVILESTRQSRDGTSYEIRELFNENLNDYYETGRLVFRKVD